MYFFLNESKIVYYSFKYNFHADSELITFKNLKFEEKVRDRFFLIKEKKALTNKYLLLHLVKMNPFESNISISLNNDQDIFNYYFVPFLAD